jgi:hypothetical protein
MSAPTVERTRATRTARAAVPGQVGTRQATPRQATPRQATPRQGAPRKAGAGRSTPRRSTGAARPHETREAAGAVGRAYARRAGRERRLVGDTGPAAARRSQFVLLIMGLLGVGLIASLWLSTTAAADSYRLDAARQATRDLTERSESLRADIASMQAAPSLARAAQEMGMVQVSDVARLVVAQDGAIRVVGTPKAAVGAPRPAPVLAVPVVQPAQQPTAQTGQPTQPGQVGATPNQQTAPAQGQPTPRVPGQQTTPQQATPQQATPQQVSVQQVPAQQAAVQRATPQQVPPQQASGASQPLAAPAAVAR